MRSHVRCLRMHIIGQNDEFVVGGGGEMMGVVGARRKGATGELEDVEMMVVAGGRRRRMRRAFVGQEFDSQGVVRRDVGRRRSFGLFNAVDFARKKRCTDGGGDARMPAFGVFDERTLYPNRHLTQYTILKGSAGLALGRLSHFWITDFSATLSSPLLVPIELLCDSVRWRYVIPAPRDALLSR